MTTVERIRLQVIEELTEGRINTRIAALKLNLSIRHIKRLKKRFKEQGFNGLIHALRGRRGLRKVDTSLENKIVKIIKNKYYDFGPLIVCEKLKEVYGITLSDETIRQIMIRNNIWKSKKRKRGQYFSWRERRSSYGELIQFDGSN